MEAYENNFQEYLILKQRAHCAGVPITTLLKFKDRIFRSHLVSLYGNGSPLSELVEYVAAFYAVEVTPQQLRKVLQRSNREDWETASNNYKQHRQAKKQERALSTSGA